MNTPTPEPASTPRLDTDKLTWAVLLGRWVDFARSAVAFPNDDAGRRMRDSVPDIIQLQAVWFALQHMEELPPDQQALGRDRAGVLIERHAGNLAKRYPGDAMPPLLAELIADAREQWSRAM